MQAFSQQCVIMLCSGSTRVLSYAKKVTGTFVCANLVEHYTSAYVTKVESWIQAEVVDTFASEAIAKEDFLSVELLSELTSEQRAALDCTMLVESNKFVGLTVSSMSYLVQELRKLRGFAPDTTNLIGDGNLDLYARTYTVKV